MKRLYSNLNALAPIFLGLAFGAASLSFLEERGFAAGKPAPKPETPVTFPKDFLWGTATAAHQVEGNNTNNDWWEWEQTCHLKDCEKSLDAVDHYRRYESDLDIAQDLKMNVYRMSVEWARLEPTLGVFSQEEFDHYRAVLKATRARGMKTMVTLHHFTLPLWMAHLGKGGWMNPAIVIHFESYTAKVVQELGDLVDYWITLNEPTVNVLTAYVAGVSPPGQTDLKASPRALANMLKAHAKAYHAIHAKFPAAQVSISHHVRIIEPWRKWFVLDVLIAKYADAFWNDQFLEAIQTGNIRLRMPFIFNYRESYPELKGTLDFLGLNYYTREYMKFNPKAFGSIELITPTNVPRSDVGWEIYPRGFYRLLKRMSGFGWPILITENGLADTKDTQRLAFICSHLKAMGQAMQEGVNVRGYIHWSLMDNFEWSVGRSPRFGLVAIDYDNHLQRTIRPSAFGFRSIIEQSNLEVCQSASGLTQLDSSETK
jgi:beta-glucosidase